METFGRSCARRMLGLYEDGRGIASAPATPRNLPARRNCGEGEPRGIPHDPPSFRAGTVHAIPPRQGVRIMAKQWCSILCSAILIGRSLLAVASLPTVLQPSVAAACAPLRPPEQAPGGPDVLDAPGWPAADCSCRAE